MNLTYRAMASFIGEVVFHDLGLSAIMWVVFENNQILSSVSLQKATIDNSLEPRLLAESLQKVLCHIADSVFNYCLINFAVVIVRGEYFFCKRHTAMLWSTLGREYYFAHDTPYGQFCARFILRREQIKAETIPCTRAKYSLSLIRSPVLIQP